MVRNPLGSAHPEATLKACIEHGAPDDAIQAAKAEFHAYLAANRSAQAASSHDLVEDSELLSEDREMDSDSQGMNTIKKEHGRLSFNKCCLIIKHCHLITFLSI